MVARVLSDTLNMFPANKTMDLLPMVSRVFVKDVITTQ
jgi:hypothetical protein